MDMGGMGTANACKISMLWNWYTIDACFLSSQWQITSSGMMAGSCIGVVCLVMTLEGLRRASREYDAFIARQAGSVPSSTPSATVETQPASSGLYNNKTSAVRVTQASSSSVPPQTFTPSLPQQLIRSLLHMCQFAVAYFVMLLAMYFNGYIIISILIGAFLGAFMFSCHKLSLPGEHREITFCCG